MSGEQMGFFAAARASHPKRLGEIVDGKPIRMTCTQSWRTDKGVQSVQVYELEGENFVRRCDNGEPLDMETYQ